jgi:hypothetical protein
MSGGKPMRLLTTKFDIRGWKPLLRYYWQDRGSDFQPRM